MGELGAIVAEPRAALLDDFHFQGQIEQGAGRGDPFVIHDVELCFREWCGDLVFDDFDLRPVASDRAVCGFDRSDPANIHADGGEELERPATWSGLRISEHHPDFLADLIGENADSLRLGNQRREFPHRGAHEAGLRTHGRVADFAIKFLLGHQRCYGVEHDHGDGIGTDECLTDLQGFLTGRRLGNEEVVQIDAELASILRIECVLDVDECCQAAALLRLGDDGERECGLAG